MADGKHRVTVTLTDDEFDMLRHWAKKKEMSINEFLKSSMDFRIAWENRDYDLAPLEVRRLDQLADIIVMLNHNVKSLESVTISGFDSLLGLTRGDSHYLSEDEDGEL